MTAPTQLHEACGYTPDVPRCRNCTHYELPRPIKTYHRPPMCGLGGFTVKNSGICRYHAPAPTTKGTNV